MMEAARTSETSVENYFTRQYILEDKSERRLVMFNINILRSLKICPQERQENLKQFLKK
jgi:hypothetical protein